MADPVQGMELEEMEPWAAWEGGLAVVEKNREVAPEAEEEG